MKIILAYSGGLDTSVLLSWIKETYDAEMIAFCAEHRAGGGVARAGGEGEKNRGVEGLY